MTSTVDIVIPVLNEEATLAANVRATIHYIHSHPIPAGDPCVVIADNGSTDRTREIAQELALEFRGSVRFTSVSLPGVGRALKHAWSESEADIVGYMDLDLATDLDHLEQALVPLIQDDFDIVYGSRLHRNSVVVGRKPTRSVVSRVFNSIVRSYLGSSVSDAMCGFKFLQRKRLHQLLDGGAKSDGWFFCAEIVLVAEAAGLRMLELPVTWTDSPDSKVNMRKLSVEYLRAMHALKPKLKAAE